MEELMGILVTPSILSDWLPLYPSSSAWLSICMSVVLCMSVKLLFNYSSYMCMSLWTFPTNRQERLATKYGNIYRRTV